MSFSLKSEGRMLVMLMLFCSSLCQAQTDDRLYFAKASSTAGHGDVGRVIVGNFVTDVGKALPDALLLAGSNGKLYTLAGDGRGWFSSTRTLSFGNWVVDMAVGDYTGDGILDCVVADRGMHRVHLLQGSKTGTFSLKSGVQVLSTPVGIAAGDFDADGAMDAAVISRAQGRVQILWGDGKGNLSAGKTGYKISSWPTRIRSGDLNKDGLPEILVVGEGLGSLDVLHNSGKRKFVQALHRTSKGPVDLVVADLNSDGNADVASADRDSSVVTVFFGDGKGALARGVPFRVEGKPSGLQAVDVNGDKRLDLVVTCTVRNRIVTLLSDAKSGFSTSLAASDADPRALGVGDLDLDGDPDLVVVSSNFLRVYRHDVAQANRITRLTVELGNWQADRFLPRNQYWDTESKTAGWVLGVTSPKPRQYFLNDIHHRVSLPADQKYWLYGDSGLLTGGALRVSVDWGAGVRDTSSFLYRCGERTKNIVFWHLDGSSKIAMARPPVLRVDRVSSNAFSQNRVDDHIFEIDVSTLSRSVKAPQGDPVVGLTLTTGYFSDFSSARQFISFGKSWDTYAGQGTWTGWTLGLSLDQAKAPLMNCLDTSVAIKSGPQRYRLYADGGIYQGRVLRLEARFMSGKRMQADFLTSCPEGKRQNSFVRLSGDPRLELGRSGLTKADLVGKSSLSPNKVMDHVFVMRILDQSAQAAYEDHAYRVSIETGSYAFGAFRPSGRYWDNWPGRSGYGGWMLGFTDSRLDASFMNCGGDGRAPLPAGTYWAYADSGIATGGTVRVQVHWTSGAKTKAVFRVGDLQKAQTWQRLSGSLGIVLGSSGQTSLDRVNADTLRKGGRSDHVFVLSLLSGGYVAYGQGCKGTVGPATLTATKGPSVGREFSLNFGGLAKTSMGVSMIGKQVNLPLAGVGAPACTLFCLPIAQFPFATGNQGKRSWTMTIPNDPNLVGFVMLNQFFVLDKKANQLGLVFSNAGIGRING